MEKRTKYKMERGQDIKWRGQDIKILSSLHFISCPLSILYLVLFFILPTEQRSKNDCAYGTKKRAPSHPAGCLGKGTGFSVPTEDEITAETIITNTFTAFSSFLKIPVAQKKEHPATLRDVWVKGQKWQINQSVTFHLIPKTPLSQEAVIGRMQTH
jgi:predicted secreted protein